MTLIGIKNIVWLASVKVISLFDSLYESFQPLTSVQVSHFVEWFSGSVIDSIWTQSGGGTFAMADATDEGFSVKTTAATSNKSTINFNNKKHYSETASIMIAVFRRVDAASAIAQAGFVNVAGGDSVNLALVRDRSNSTFKELFTADGSTGSVIASDVVIDQVFTNYKIECGSANIKLTIDGVLKVTKTTNRPAARLQPTCWTQTEVAVIKESRFRYLEYFNTSVTILSSLYERLSALTQVMGQRVVETFDGSVLSERWTTDTGVGTPTYAMADSVDGGFTITTGSSANDRGSISFNGKHQYAFDGSVLIYVGKADSIVNTIAIAALNSGVTFAGGNDWAYVGNHSAVDSTNFTSRTSSGSAQSTTSTGVALDTNYHVFKTETKSSSVEFSIDGVLKTTITTNLPNRSLQPMYTVQADEASSKVGSILYLEAYNKLTTETDFPSVYEIFNPLTTVAKSHFWDWFDGNDVKNMWTKKDVQGTGTFAMVDGIDEGYSVTTSAATSDRSGLSFNNIRHYNKTGSVIIIVAKRNTVGLLRSGFRNVLDTTTIQLAQVQCNDTSTFKELITGDTSLTVTATDIAVDASFHAYKIELSSTDCQLTIDGVLKATNTTNLPTLDQQPNPIWVQEIGTGAVEARVRYCEAYNT